MPKNEEISTGRLINKLGLMGANDLSDELYAIAYNIEETLLRAGAIPGEDYKYLDLIGLAQPFVLEMLINKTKGISYTYPADHVAKP